MQALDVLQAVSGYTRAQEAVDRRVRLGTVDPAYVASTYPTTLPKITFDGESTLSGKTYAVVGPYWPTAGDRVALIPIGTTYAIVGALDSDASARVGGSLTVSGAVTAGSITTATWTAPTLLNSWANLGSGYEATGYVKTPDGTVWVKGTVSGASKTANTIFTLPSGYRPTGGTRMFACVGNGGLAIVEVTTAGAVTFSAGSASSYLTLDPVHFRP
jgi:hypothetical protein